jgi:hypothetical protein
MKRLYILGFLFVSMAASAQQSVAVLGSSTSACTGPTNPANCYLAKLDAYYEGLGQPTTIHQLAVGGYSVYKGMPSSFTGPWPNLQPDVNRNITRALELNPTTILVNYPSNGYDTLRIDSVMRCFRTIRDSANAQGKTCYITTTQPRTSFSAPARAKLKELRDSILLQFGYFAINFWDDLADPSTYAILPAYDADGIHLNDAGHEILFQRVRAKNIFAVALPVKLASFMAKPQQGEVMLSWMVKDETDGTRYDVQRSPSGTDFMTVATVNATGNNASRSYNIVDNSVRTATAYYRLMLTENGISSFSQVVRVTIGKSKVMLKDLSVTQRQLVMNVSSAGAGRIQMNFINSAGVLVRKSQHSLQPGDNTLRLPMAGLPSGSYWAECLSDGNKVFTRGIRIL